MKASILTIFLSISIFVFPGVKITGGPYLQKMGEHEVTIIWTTNTNAVSWLELKADSTNLTYFDTAQGIKKIGKFHSITLKGLSPGTEYGYRVFSKNVLLHSAYRSSFGNTVSSVKKGQDFHYFKTLDKSKESLSIKVINDIHGKDKRLSAMLSGVDRLNTDFVFFNGDMTNVLNNERQIFKGFMNASVDIFAKEVPVFYARGNHETRGRANTELYKYFPSPTGNFYYAFRDGPVYFMVIDVGEDKADSHKHYSGLAAYAQYRSEQQDWVEEIVASPEFQAAPFRVVIMHIPPSGSRWRLEEGVEDKLIPALNNANIDVVLSGHNHVYSFTNTGENPTYNFPILVNAAETWLDINIDTTINIKRRDMNGNVLNTHTFNQKE